MTPSGYRRKVTSPSHKAESKLELERVCELSKSIPSDILPPARPDLLNSLNSTSNWELSVQMPELLEDISHLNHYSDQGCQYIFVVSPNSKLSAECGLNSCM